MAYIVIYRDRNGRETAREEWDYFPQARDLAERSVKFGTARSAEVQDESGQVLFQRPRATRNA